MEVYQIAFFGATNSGKSTLVNALAGQEVSLVSPQPGTTTDPVRKRIELPGIGACVLVDTAGYGDGGALGGERERRSRSVIDGTDVAVLLCSGHPEDEKWEALLQKAGVPVVQVELGGPERSDTECLLRRIAEALPKDAQRWLTGDLVRSGDSVLLVMPQDSAAPKGRLILPQVQLLRELLDRGCVPHCCTPESLEAAMASLSQAPALVITDSQVFARVNDALPPDWPLTSFSILLAAAKGDARVFLAGAAAIDRLQAGDRVLIAEACTHVPDTEDIGRVKIPALLQRAVATLGHVRGRGPSLAMGGAGANAEAVCNPTTPTGLQVEVAAGNDFPEDLSPYSLIIHCGACVATASLVRARLRKALLAGVPITNYGFALAKLQGILERVCIP